MGVMLCSAKGGVCSSSASSFLYCRVGCNSYTRKLFAKIAVATIEKTGANLDNFWRSKPQLIKLHVYVNQTETPTLHAAK